MKKLLVRLKAVFEQRFRENIVVKVALALSIIVVFCTTYALILPALTVSTDNSSSVVQSTESASENDKIETSSNESQTESQVSSEQSSTIENSETDLSFNQIDSSQAGQLSATSDNVIVTIDYEVGTFDDNVTLRVTPVQNTAEITQKISGLLRETKQELSQAHSYDISFVNAAEQEVEPKKDVAVSMSFADAIKTADVQSSWKLYHFVNNDFDNVENLTEQTETTINQDESSNVKSLSFQSDSFSTYTIAEVTYADFSGYLDDYSVSSSTVDLATGVLTTHLVLSFSNLTGATLADNTDYYLKIPDGVTVQTGSEFNILDRNGNKAATFEFVKDGSNTYMLIHFLDSYVSTLAPTTDVTASFYYDMEMGEELRNDKGAYVADFSDKITVTVTADVIEKNYDLDTEKEAGVISYDGDKAYINYTVLVNSLNGTPDEITISDVLTASGVSIESVDNIAITKSTYVGSRSQVTSTENISANPTFNTSSGSWSLTLPQLISGGLDASGNRIGHFYTITYRYCFSGLTVSDGDVSVNNKVTVNSSDDGKNDVKDEDSTTNVISLVPDIQKTGSYDSSTGLIKWEITINKNQNDIAGSLLTDDHFSEISGDVSISPNTDYVLQYSNGKFSGIKFSKTVDGTNKQTYTITYMTKVPDNSFSNQKITNTAIIDKDGNISTTDDRNTDSYGVTLPGTGSVLKNFVASEDTSDANVKVATWSTKISMSDEGILPSGTILTDRLTAEYNEDNTKHWYTASQLADIYSKMVKLFGADGFTMTVSKNYGKQINYEAIDSSETYTRYTITLTKDYAMSSDLTYTYQSTLDVSSLSSQTEFRNVVTIGDVSSVANYPAKVVTKTDGNGNEGTSVVTSVDGSLTWIIKVILNKDTTNLTVTDTLPDDVSISSITYGTRYGPATAVIDGNTISAGQNTYSTKDIGLSGNISGNDVVLNFTAPDNGTINNAINNESTFYVTVAAQYDMSKVEAGKTATLLLTNNVVVSSDNENLGSDSQTQEVTIGKTTSTGDDKDVINKIQTGSTSPMIYDNSGKSSINTNSVGYTHVLNYSIDINPDAEDLASGSDTLTLTDTLQYYKEHVTYSLIHGSVILYDEDGDKVPDRDWAWTYEDVPNSPAYPTQHRRSIITVTLPDSGHYVLKYNYQISDATEGSYHTVMNTSKLEGVNNGVDSDTTTYKYVNQSGGGSVYTSGTYTLNKVDAANYGHSLPGATFTVYKYDGDDDDSNDEEVTSYITDSYGEIHISNPSTNQMFDYDTIYYVVETAAASGYELPKEALKYYFTYTKNLNVDVMTPIALKGQVTDLSEHVGVEYVPNAKIDTVNLTVNKQWLDADGNDVGSADGLITYDVMQVATAEDGTTSELVYKSGETMSHSDNWTRTYKELPLTNSDKTVTYTYYIREQAVSGYDTIYDNGATTSKTPSEVALASESAVITIKNIAQKQYALPQTGGRGQLLYYILGLAILLISVGILAAVLYQIYHRGIL
ncbi:SpaA isopeptide-forming pilin-related protein [Streptococcus equinus]|uniref:SpaA isopeptide-forming pilin-related protein n=1 Tax=Streptococcus equinus TaxID=1335 RepID=UPI0008EE824C|nr:SpaA isopeptide-forming pilin-related protein [Streptococcus equinus]SFQ55680.1 hypothetical protein SAMN05216422_0074 [Streptococcus equinus]